VRVRYVVPGPMGRSRDGAAELQRRQQLLRGWARPGTEVTVADSATGPASIESGYEDHLAVPILAAALARAEQDQVEAMIIGCYDDPGCDALREIASTTIVVGPALASLHLAALVGTRIGILTVPEPGPIRRLVNASRLQDHVCDVAVIRSTVLELQDRSGPARDEIAAAAAQLAGSGADVIVLGCMSLGFLGVDEQLSDDLGVPVVNPARAALATAELLVHANLHPSKVAYPMPPKLRAGTPVSDFLACGPGTGGE
jgi:allantoin racemase